MSELGQTLLYTFGGIWIIALAINMLPVRRAYRFTIEKWITAPPERIWDIYRTNLNDPASKTFHEHVLRHDRVEGNPPVETALCELDDAGQHRRIVRRHAILLERRPEIIQVQSLGIGEEAAPYGPKHNETTEFSRRDGGTLLHFAWEGELKTLGQRRLTRLRYGKVFDRLAAVCEGKKVASALRPQSPLVALAISVLAIVSFGIVFGWMVGVILSLALVIHEFGHWLAMRLTGQPAPRVMLLPFLGGVTIANHPHKTYFNDAFCALMGAGFSALPALALLLLAFWFDPSGEPSQPRLGIVAILAISAFVIGAINLLQLLPFLPLDGGQVLRAIMQSFNVRWTKYVLLAIGGVGMAGFFHFGEPLLAGIVGIGVLQSWHMPAARGSAQPMSGLGLAAMICAFLMTAAVHGAAAYYGLALMRQLHD